MVDGQKIEGFASRESLPVEVLIELIFEASIDKLEEQWKAIKIYPHLATEEENKRILAYEKFTKWVIALIHPNPGNRASIFDVLDFPINSQDIYSWLCKNQSNLYLSSDTKLFIKFFKANRTKGNPDILDHPTQTNPQKLSNPRREVGKQDTLARHKSWQKAYRKLKRTHPGKSDNWYSKKIAKMDISQGRSSETIRKNMKN